MSHSNPVSTAASDRNTPMSQPSPAQKQAIVRTANTSTKLRYRHDPYQLATNAIVSCDQSSNCSSQQGLDTRTVSPECAQMVSPYRPQQVPCDMSLESHENYNYMAHPPPLGHTEHPAPPAFQQADLSGQPSPNLPPGQGSQSTSRSSEELYFSNNNTNAQSSSNEGLSSHYHEMLAKLYDKSSSSPVEQTSAPVQQRQRRNNKQRQVQKKKQPQRKVLPAPYLSRPPPLPPRYLCPHPLQVWDYHVPL